MKKFMKILSTVMAILCIITCFASCGDTSDDTTAPTLGGNTEPGKDQYGRDFIDDSVPKDLTFEGKDVTFFVRNDGQYWEIEMDADSTTNDTVNDAIFYRNDTVEKRLGIEINQISQAGTFGPHTQWLQTLRN